MEAYKLLDFLSNYYHLEILQIRKYINWICSNFISSNKTYCMSLVKSELFSMIMASIKKEKSSKVMEEILYLIMNILSYNDSEISFTFLNYDLLQNLIDVYYSNAENWNILLHIFILNVFKSIFGTENKYKLKEEKNQNFDDNNVNFIDYFLRQGCLEFLSNLRTKHDVRIDACINDIENEINIRFNYIK